MLKNEGDRLTRVAVCAPRSEYFLVDDLAAHNIREVADRERARLQHEALRAVLVSRGAEVIDVGECPGHPNSVFTRDMAVGSPTGFIQSSMGIITRVGEDLRMAEVLSHMGEPCAGVIRPPGTVEGGDVVIVGSVAFVGQTRRTNPEGIRQLGILFEAMGLSVRVVVLPEPFLHLDQILGVLGPDQLIVCRDMFPKDLLRGFRFLSLPCARFNVNFICLGPDEIIAPVANTPLIDAVEKVGVRVHALDLSEFAKGTGGPNCLIMPIERI